MKNNRLYYTDGEIYINLKQGVNPRILAELNACTIKEIIQAKDRYIAKLKESDEAYNILKDELMRRRNPMENDAKPKRYAYTDEIIGQIKYYLKKDVSTKEIYNLLFTNKHLAPVYQAFVVKCKNLVKSMGIIYFGEASINEVELYEKPISIEAQMPDQSVIRKSSEKKSSGKKNKSLKNHLEELRQNYIEEIGDLVEKMVESMYEIAKLDISIEQLEKE